MNSDAFFGMLYPEFWERLPILSAASMLSLGFTCPTVPTGSRRTFVHTDGSVSMSSDAGTSSFTDGLTSGCTRGTMGTVHLISGCASRRSGTVRGCLLFTVIRVTRRLGADGTSERRTDKRHSQFLY